MKPLKLIMSAFLPYSTKTEIDFEAFNSEGLFLITGETGAGKTSIFDAVSYALYGEVSGENRGTDALRSDFADPSEPTFVNLTFSHKGAVYEVERVPKHSRPAKRGGGTTVQSAEAKLLLPNGGIITGISPVTEAIVELLGINHRQFKQTVMVAQGEFLKLLLADSTERAEIFRKVFGTKHFQSAQECLKSAAAVLHRELETMQTEIISVSGGIICTAGHPLFERTALVSDDFNKQSALLEILAEIIDYDDTQKNVAEKRTAEISVKLQALSEQLFEANKTNDTLVRLKELTEKLSALEAEKPKLAESEARLARAKKSLYTVRPHETNYVNQNNRTEQLRKAVAEGNNSLKFAAEMLAECENVVSAEKGKASEREALAAAINKVNESLPKYAELSKKQTAFNLLCTENNIIDKEAQSIEEKYSAAKLNCADLEQRFYTEQAGIIASRLTSGEACPVCGADTHPNPAVLSENAPSQAQLENEKNSLDRLLACLQAAKELELLKQHLTFENEASAMADIAENQNALTKLKNQLDDAEKNYNKAHIEKSEISAVLKENTEQFTYAKAALKLAEAEFKTVLEKSEFENEQDYRNALAAGEDIERLEEEISQYKIEYEKTAAANDEIKKSTEGKEYRDTAELDTALAEARDELKDASAAMSDLDYALKTNRNIEALLLKKHKKYSETENKYEQTRLLADTANGTLTGKVKMSFEQYVQRVYFGMVLSEANKRLLKMSDGRYTLLFREDGGDLRGKTGLALDAEDYWTGRRRSVSSLSGGESFKASLSLALGLSDVVQGFAGGVQLETMFVDEGFGALDSESLESALDILAELTGGSRLVGIISHVDELKERIEKKIVIKKERQGSYATVEA